jgi:uncharacterized protein (DUF1015 family)
MAQVLPFKGIRYNPQHIGDLSKVVTPPYDVISSREQQAFYDRHPNNIIRLDLNPATVDDSAENTPHTRAAANFEAWQNDGALMRDEKPAVYLTSVTFPLNDIPVTRYGMIVAVRLEPFDKGIVLPHEKTFSKVKSERLELMKVCHANFSPIFSLYSDEGGIQETVRAAAKDQTPELDVIDDMGLCHKMWVVNDADVLQRVTAAFDGKQLFIADGHHRYETALNYRNWVAGQDPNFSDDHPANFVMMYLSSMEDPGLIVLPAHRMLLDVPAERLSGLTEKASAYFDVEVMPAATPPTPEEKDAFFERLASRADANAIGVYIGTDTAFSIFTLKAGAMEARFGDEISGVLGSLDVTVLTRLIFMELLGFDQERLDNEKLIGYSSSGHDAIAAVVAGKYEVAFLLNSTKTEQVRAIAEQGLIMPRKTTYFFPKVITGQVMNVLR